MKFSTLLGALSAYSSRVIVPIEVFISTTGLAARTGRGKHRASAIHSNFFISASFQAQCAAFMPYTHLDDIAATRFVDQSPTRSCRISQRPSRLTSSMILLLDVLEPATRYC